MLRDIGGRGVGPRQPVYVIAEIGINHGGSIDRALEMVDAAAWAGVSAIKLQTLDASELVAPHCPPPAHVQDRSLRDFFGQFELDQGAHRAVVARARTHGLGVLTTPLAEQALDWLEPLAFDGYKIASGDITYSGLIARAASTGKPLLVSTGMSSLWEISAAIETARGAGGAKVGLLHCVSAYPAPRESQNLRAIATLSDAFGLPVGYSDHGPDASAAVPAITLGAVMYERHLMLDGDDTAVDRTVSSTPQELKKLIATLASTQCALGDGRKVCQPAEAVNVHASRRGLYARRRLRAGQVVTADDLAVLRPRAALEPRHADLLIGRTAGRDIDEGEAFEMQDIGVEQAS